MTKKRAGAGSTVLLAAIVCGCLGGTSPVRTAETAPADPAAQIARGKTLFISYGCGWCHEGGGRKAGRCPQLMGTERDDNFILSRIAAGLQMRLRRLWRLQRLRRLLSLLKS